jgi:hypothetical protein
MSNTVESHAIGNGHRHKLPKDGVDRVDEWCLALFGDCYVEFPSTAGSMITRHCREKTRLESVCDDATPVKEQGLRDKDPDETAVSSVSNEGRVSGYASGLAGTQR